jgi:hypothetical protein
MVARSVTSTAGAVHRADGGIDALRVEVGDDHARALGGEAGGGGQSDALGRAGDDGDFVSEAHDADSVRMGTPAF